MHTLVDYFFSEKRFLKKAGWFKKAVYLFLLVKCVYWCIHFKDLFGANTIVYQVQYSYGVFKNLPFLLSNAQSCTLNALCIALLFGLGALYLVFGQLSLAADAAAWLITLNLHYAIYPALSGGDLLLNQFLFFACFINPKQVPEAGYWKELKHFVHNLACWAVMLQVCLVYFVSALAKLADEGWMSGQAIAAVSQIRHFSIFSFPAYTTKLNWLYTFLTYTVLIYQAGFSVLVWIKAFKMPLLICGILMHVYIALVMGLPLFGTVMIISYIFFWPLKELKDA